MSEQAKASYWTGAALALGMFVRIMVTGTDATGVQQLMAIFLACILSLSSWAGVGILLAGFFFKILEAL